MNKIPIIGFVILLLSGCATTKTANINILPSAPSLTLAQEESWKLMIGKWYGSQPITGGGTRREIVERMPNGTYKIAFRTYGSNGGVDESVEKGLWGVSGPIYFSIFQGYNEGKKYSPVNSSDPYNYNAYKIIQLSNEVFEYESFATGNRYILKRVPADFDFPNDNPA